MAQKLVVGNWKLNNDLQDSTELIDNILKKSSNLPSDVQIAIAPAFPFLNRAVDLTSGELGLSICSQSVSHYKRGAYTGEVSAQMLSSLGVSYCIVGHSERREYFNESSEDLKSKIDLVLENEMQVIYCCGESLQLRKSGKYLDYITSQINDCLFHLNEIEIANVVIAYEPIWAIGTGETASKEEAQEVHFAIRNLLKGHYSQEIADNISILYGGSCNPANAKDLFAQTDIDGGLIGGASLNAEDFIQIANSY